MNNKHLLALAALALAMIGLAIIGGFRNYSPIPWFDAWDGILQFCMDVEGGDQSGWWKQHNEHRIVLSRALFWLDCRFFGGLSGFLIALNYFLAGGAVYTFWRFLRESAGTRTASGPDIALALFVAAWLFLWSQDYNFTWGFQSQFFLAQLLPLGALYWFAKSTKSANGRPQFLVACALGLLSVGTMANGVLILPLLASFSALLRQGKARTGLLLALSAASLGLYLQDYQSPSGHGNLIAALKDNPLGLLHFALLYVGSPFFFLFGSGATGKTGALLAGLSLVIASAQLSWRLAQAPTKSPMAVGLLFFILYIGSTALGSASGRFVFGVDIGMSSRYTTPALMAWSALFVALHSSYGRLAGSKAQKLTFAAMAVLGLLMLVEQFKAVNPMDEVLSGRQVAALALALDITDQEYIPRVYPVSEHALHIARDAVAKKFSIFGIYPFADLAKELGKPASTLHSIQCLGHWDRTEAMVESPHFVRVHGWLFDPEGKTSPKLIRLADSAGIVVGFALSGTPRPDVGHAIGNMAGLAGFRGYLESSALGKTIVAQGDHPACRVSFHVPTTPQ